MKLGEAKERLKRVCTRLNEVGGEIVAVPIQDVHGALRECSDLLHDRLALSQQVALTENETILGGESLSRLYAVSEFLNDEISFLVNAVRRGDLAVEVKHELYERTKQLRITRDNLERSIQKCVWETELISK